MRIEKESEYIRKTVPLTDEELKDLAKQNDFTTSVPMHDAEKSSNAENSWFMHIKKIFSNSFFGRLRGKKRAKNYSNDHPVKCLEKADEDIVSGAVTEIMKNPELASDIIKSAIAGNEDAIERIAKEYAVEVGKTIDELDDNDQEIILFRFADGYLDFMMGKLQIAQQVPEIMEITHGAPAEEDYNRSVQENHDLIDFDRKWNHSRSRIGRMISYEGLDPEQYVFNLDGSLYVTDETDKLFLEEFIKTLSDPIDQEIVRLGYKGCTQAEIATHLSYKSQATVAKRMKAIREKFGKYFVI